MSSVINWIKGFAKKGEEQRCLILGLDASGKTTFLYQLKLGEIVTTIPTIGFNVETLKAGCVEITCWDVGGCDKIRPLTRHYFSDGNSFLFMIDVHDLDRLPEALEEMRLVVIDCANSHMIPFIGIVLNKQDRPGTTRELVENITEKVHQAMKEIVMKVGHNLAYKIYNEPGLSSKTGHGCKAVLEDVVTQRNANMATAYVPNNAERKSADRSIASEGTITLKSIDQVPTKEELLVKIRARREANPTPYDVDTFLSVMKRGNLQVWDHGVHIYAAWGMLAKTLCNAANTTTPASALLIAVDDFLVHLEQMLESQPGKFRNTLHRTMTTFWMYEIYIAMIMTPSINYNLVTTRRHTEMFNEFLEKNPFLMYGGVWKHYYSKELLFSQKAKDHWCLPDQSPLPKLPSSTGMVEEIRTFVNGYSSHSAKDLQSNERLKQWAYGILQRVKATKSRRGPIVKESLERLEQDTMRHRAQDARHLESYSETQAYFWIQIVHNGIEAIERNVEGFDVTKIGYDSFVLLFPDVFGGEDVWKEYYDDETWRSVEARKRFVSPKKGTVRRALPNFTVIDTKKNDNKDWRTCLDVKIPSTQELTQRAAYMGNYEPPAPPLEVPVEAPVEAPIETPVQAPDDEDDGWVEIPKNSIPPAPPLPPPGYKSISSTPVPLEKEPLTVAVTAQLSKLDINNPQWCTHADIIYGFFSKFAELQHPSHMMLSRAAYFAIRDLKGSYSVNTLTFWSRLVLEKFMDTYHVRTNSDETASNYLPSKNYGFKSFLLKNPELAWEGLWRVYYSELAWMSLDATEHVLKPDRNIMRAFLGR